MHLPFKPLFLALSLAAASGAHAYSNVYFEGSSPYVNRNGTLVFDGVRAEGGNVTLKDALRLEYEFDLPSLNYLLKKKLTYTNVGVFNDWHMAIDVTPAQPPYEVNGLRYQSGQTYTFNATRAKPFKATFNLKPGHVLSWLMQSQTASYTTSFIGGSTNSVFSGEAYGGIISGAERALEGGTYTLTITPQSATSMSFSLRVFNANSRQLKTASNGSRIYESFENNARDYAKYALNLNAGQQVTIPKPSESNIGFKLVNKLGATVATTTGLPLIYTATKSDKYYLFIYNQNGWGQSYSGTVAVKTVPKAAGVAAEDGTPAARVNDATAAAPVAGAQ